MAWLYLVLASLFEVGWPLSFKMASVRHESFGWYISLAIVSMTFSGLFLYLAQRTIPISTAYIVWTGIGAVSTFLIGLLFFGDSASVQRMFFALLILVGVVGMKVTTK